MLDFQGYATRLNLGLQSCLFRDRLVLQDAKLRGLYLTGSRAEQGVDLDRLTTETNVHLSDKFHATGLVNLGARVLAGSFPATVGG